MSDWEICLGFCSLTPWSEFLPLFSWLLQKFYIVLSPLLTSAAVLKLRQNITESPPRTPYSIFSTSAALCSCSCTSFASPDSIFVSARLEGAAGSHGIEHDDLQLFCSCGRWDRDFRSSGNCSGNPQWDLAGKTFFFNLFASWEGSRRG